MKYPSLLMLIVKVVALFIVIVYAIGLFRTYDKVQASAMLVVAALMGVDLIFMAKQATSKKL